jgi:PetM family of cytochrome b6f complex subunit 7
MLKFGLRGKAALPRFVYLSLSLWSRAIMGGEIFNAAIIPFVLVLVGLGLGYLLLKLTPEED